MQHRTEAKGRSPLPSGASAQRERERERDRERERERERERDSFLNMVTRFGLLKHSFHITSGKKKQKKN